MHSSPHIEDHRSHRSVWLRAAVLGANDGIVSTASLIIGVAQANSSHETILIAGVAGLVAGAMSMAAGEYVSVSSQSDTQKADLLVEEISLRDNYDEELEELAGIYESRGLDRELAVEVSRQLMAHGALEAHARDEIGISEIFVARPVLAAFSSAATFTVGASLPLFAAFMAPLADLAGIVAVSSLAFLAALGALASRAGGAPMGVGALRVTFWGGLAMFVTALVGNVFDMMT